VESGLIVPECRPSELVAPGVISAPEQHRLGINR
jgi:hypothetical protein